MPDKKQKSRRLTYDDHIVKNLGMIPHYLICEDLGIQVSCFRAWAKKRGIRIQPPMGRDSAGMYIVHDSELVLWSKTGRGSIEAETGDDRG